LELLDKFIETFVDVSGLLFVEPLDFLFDVFNELAIVIVYSFSV
jgi:hypothetical protein